MGRGRAARPFTVFYYYQPQQIILEHAWSVDLGKVWHTVDPLAINVIAVLAAVGVSGLRNGAVDVLAKRFAGAVMSVQD